METYCVKCKKQTKFEGEPIVTMTKNNRHMLKGKCIECSKTKTRLFTNLLIMLSLPLLISI